MFGYYRDCVCPRCRKVYAFQVVSAMFVELGTKLGPPLVKCASCGSVFDSGLSEWLRMSNPQKFRYLYLSVLYAIVEGMILALIPLFIFDGIFNPSKLRTFVPASEVLPVILFCTFPVFGFQVLRILLSNKRVRENIRKPMNASYWNWETNPQGNWLTLSVIIIAVFCIVAYLRGVI